MPASSRCGDGAQFSDQVATLVQPNVPRPHLSHAFLYPRIFITSTSTLRARSTFFRAFSLPISRRSAFAFVMSS
jgi:hypothetical protein